MKLFPNYTYKSASITYNSLKSININIIFLVLHPYWDEKKNILSRERFSPMFLLSQKSLWKGCSLPVTKQESTIPTALFQFILKCFFNSCQRRHHRDFPEIFIFHIPASSIQRQGYEKMCKPLISALNRVQSTMDMLLGKTDCDCNKCEV